MPLDAGELTGRERGAVSHLLASWAEVAVKERTHMARRRGA